MVMSARLGLSRGISGWSMCPALYCRLACGLWVIGWTLAVSGFRVGEGGGGAAFAAFGMMYARWRANPQELESAHEIRDASGSHAMASRVDRV